MILAKISFNPKNDSIKLESYPEIKISKGGISTVTLFLRAYVNFIDYE